jgi:hypothetical protein
MRLPTFLAIAPLALACSAGDQTGVAVQMVVCDNGDDVCIDVPPPEEGVELTCAWFMVRNVKLVGNDDAGFDARIWEPLDLLDPTSSAIDILDVEPGTYERLRLQIHAEEGFLPGPTGRKVSMMVCATIDGVAIEYRDDTWESIVVRPDAGIEVVPGELAKLALRFDTSDWFDDVDVSELEPAADGIVYIDEENRHDLQNAIRDRIRDSIDLVKKER